MVKNLPGSAGDVGLIPRLERSPGGGNGNPLQYSCPWRISWTRLGNRAHMHISLTEALLSPDPRPSAPLLGRPCLLFVPCREQQGTLGTLGLTRHPVFCCAQHPQLL